MLWSLALAAAAGVLAVLAGGHEAIMRFLGTAGLTVAACLLALRLTKLTDQPTTHAAGMFGVTVVLIVYILFNINIWGLDTHWLTERHNGKLFFSAMALAWTAAVAVALLKKIHQPSTRVAAYTGLGLAGIYWVLCLLATWWPHGGARHYYASPTQEHLWETAWVFALAAVTTTAALIGVGHDKKPQPWRWLGIVAGIGAFVAGLYASWWEQDEAATWIVVSASVAVVIGYANIVTRARLMPAARWLIPCNIIALAVVAGGIDLLVIQEQIGSADELLARGVGAVGIVSACGTLALAILAGLNRKRIERPLDSTLTEISLTCPSCHKKQTLPLGDSRCAGCGMRIHTRITEPRCPACDYSLYKITCDRCPECGALVDDPEAAPPTIPAVGRSPGDPGGSV